MSEPFDGAVSALTRHVNQIVVQQRLKELLRLLLVASEPEEARCHHQGVWSLVVT